MRWEISFHSFSHEIIRATQSSASLENAKAHSMAVFKKLRGERKRIAKIVIKELEKGGSVYVREISDMGKPQSNWSLGGKNE